MDEVKLRRVTYEKLSSLQHEVAVSEGPRFQAPEFLVVRFSGSYRDGAAGKEDTLYILAAAASARKAWWSHSTILDFRDLAYRWGDEMEWITSIGWNPGVRLNEPLAIVAGDNCRNALQSLLREDYNNYCVDTLEEAFAMCRRTREEYEIRLKEFRERI